jgi:CheY-like chemotaxis protein
VVLLDIGMPGMDGYEVARLLRTTWPTPPVCIVAVTGWGEAGDMERTREAGFDHHFVKPIDFDALKLLIASMESGAES